MTRRPVHRSVARLLVLGGAYSALLLLSLWTAYLLRFDFDIPPAHERALLLAAMWTIPLKLAFLWAAGQFRGLLSYFSSPDLQQIAMAIGGSSAVILTLRLLDVSDMAPPRGVILGDALLSFFAICGLRYALRLLRERYIARKQGARTTARRIAIVGAGDVGAALACEMIAKPRLGMQPVAFFDDVKPIGASVHGVPVIGAPEALLAQPQLKSTLEVSEVVIAMPSATAKRIGEVVAILRQAGVKMRTVPSLAQLASGQVKVTSLRQVEIQDLLGRAAVEVDDTSVRRLVAGSTVMVTGAGGSIGSELCRQIAAYGPAKLLLVERSEPHLFAIEQELLEQGHSAEIVPLVADVLEVARMEQIFSEYNPEKVFHAAAHKHVPMMERQPAEAVKNNAIATAHLATLASFHGVRRFVLISTDKAINPTSVMGASKRLAEMFLQALHATTGNTTKFMAVRFGNVLGSSGSVVPTFTRQIAAGGPVKVTHPDMTRYFMTIPEATRLVLQSAAQGAGGEIFVLDMGNPVKIIDLARQMIELSGLRPGVDIDIEITGARPGEKLFEELSHSGENTAPTNHPKIMRFVADPLPFTFMRTAVDEFVRCVNQAAPSEVKQMLRVLIPEYQPFGIDDATAGEEPSQFPFLEGDDQRPEAASQSARVA
jgi:FlaA1/EpsC-like NDP-sugar epimerase